MKAKQQQKQKQKTRKDSCENMWYVWLMGFVMKCKYHVIR